MPWLAALSPILKGNTNIFSSLPDLDSPTSSSAQKAVCDDSRLLVTHMTSHHKALTTITAKFYGR